jgi:hypothetical protein
MEIFFISVQQIQQGVVPDGADKGVGVGGTSCFRNLLLIANVCAPHRVHSRLCAGERRCKRAGKIIGFKLGGKCTYKVT